MKFVCVVAVYNLYVDAAVVLSRYVQNKKKYILLDFWNFQLAISFCRPTLLEGINYSPEDDLLWAETYWSYV
jgi:hypothetical protein